MTFSPPSLIFISVSLLLRAHNSKFKLKGILSFCLFSGCFWHPKSVKALVQSPQKGSFPPVQGLVVVDVVQVSGLRTSEQWLAGVWDKTCRLRGALLLCWLARTGCCVHSNDLFGSVTQGLGFSFDFGMIISPPSTMKKGAVFLLLPVGLQEFDLFAPVKNSDGDRKLTLSRALFYVELRGFSLCLSPSSISLWYHFQGFSASLVRSIHSAVWSVWQRNSKSASSSFLS